MSKERQANPPSKFASGAKDGVASGRSLAPRGRACRCVRCDLHFATVDSLIEHQLVAGDRCLTANEMRGAGWEETARGWCRHPATSATPFVRAVAT